MARRSSPASRRRTRIALVLVLVVFVNLPLAHSTWTRWQIESDGVDVTATVVTAEVVSPDDDPSYWITFRYDEDVDPRQDTWPAEVDRRTYDVAEETGELRVRTLEDDPAAYVVEGEVRRWAGVVVTILADLVLLVVVLMVRRFGARPRRPYLRMAAVDDVRRCPPGSALDRIEGNLYLVRGEVSAIEEDEIVLDLGDREVYVVLDGHANPVGHQQPAEVRGWMIE